jgi:hypothetical protein
MLNGSFRILRYLLAASLICINGCHILIPWMKSSIDGSCFQTFEFANNGCAELVVIVEVPPGSLPDSYHVTVRAIPVHRVSDIGFGGGESYDMIPDAVPLRLIRWDWGPGDTASAWIVAELVDRIRRRISNGQYQTITADSVLHVVRFVPVGEVPRVDTVWLKLHYP